MIYDFRLTIDGCPPRAPLTIKQTLNAVQEKEKSEAQRATKERDAALDALEDWYTEFRELSLIALEDDSQRLEALGLGSIP